MIVLQFRALPFNVETLDESAQVLIKDPENLNASPQGWNSDGTTDFQ